ncbi:MAG: SIS domain-containing protein [Candidatus Omnitrophica bacterium]|nr:SIS domain-containing protein [Candidatus Omnitrophota bacterium]
MLMEYYENMKKVFDAFVDRSENLENMAKAKDILENTRKAGKCIYLIGNGGSASVAEHVAIDLTKNAGLRATALSGATMITTFSNDYGYENVFKKYLESFAFEDDVLIAISSSGSSKNIVNACDEARRKSMHVITLSGFKGDNPLRMKGDINFWVETEAFGFLEILHSLILHWINDSIIGKEVYMIR